MLLLSLLCCISVLHQTRGGHACHVIIPPHAILATTSEMSSTLPPRGLTGLPDSSSPNIASCSTRFRCFTNLLAAAETRGDDKK